MSSMFGNSTFTQVIMLVGRKEFATAIVLLRGALEDKPNDILLTQQLAEVLALDGQKRAAAEELAKLAEEHARKGEPGKAIAAYKKAQQLDPDATAGHHQLAGIVKERDGDDTASRAPRPPTLVNETLRIDLDLSEKADKPRAVKLEEVDDVDRTEEFQLPEVFAQAPPAGGILEPEPEPEEAEAPAPTASVSGSPLFSSFSKEELAAVIQGLKLVSYEPGDVIVSEGEPGNSLFVLTTGTVKAFVRDGTGKNHRIRSMSDGSFFGEISILLQKRRTATIVAATACELLELDRPTLDEITETHPRVQAALKAFCSARLNSAAELFVRKKAGQER